MYFHYNFTKLHYYREKFLEYKIPSTKFKFHSDTSIRAFQGELKNFFLVLFFSRLLLQKKDAIIITLISKISVLRSKMLEISISEISNAWRPFEENLDGHFLHNN